MYHDCVNIKLETRPAFNTFTCSLSYICFNFFYTCKFCVLMLIYIMQQWESTLWGERWVDFKTMLSSPCHPFFSLCPPPSPQKYLPLRLNSLLWSVSQEPLMSCHSCRNRVSPQVLHRHQLLPFYWSFLWCLLWLKNIYTCKTECIVEDGILSTICKVHSCSHSNRDDQCCITKISTFWVTYAISSGGGNNWSAGNFSWFYFPIGSY